MLMFSIKYTEEELVGLCTPEFAMDPVGSWGINMFGSWPLYKVPAICEHGWFHTSELHDLSISVLEQA